MRTHSLPAAAAALAAGLLACSGTLKDVSAKNPVPGIREGDWEAVRSKATRRFKLSDRFEHRATVTATYLGAPEREAKVNRLALWLGWTEQEKAQHLKEELAEAAKYEEFLVALYTAHTKDNDLDSKTSVWRMAIKVDGGDVVSHDARAMNATATITGLFPYVSPFDIIYRVRFDKVAGAPLSGRPFTLEFASALGKMPMQFGDGTVGPDRPPGTPLAD
jgi:hypothetical protein